MSVQADQREGAARVRREVQALAEGEIHVWTIPSAPGAPRTALRENVLSDGELKKSRGFRNPVDAERYALAHGWLRCILAAYAGLPPGELEFTEAEFGKPFLKNNKRGIRFSMSHSGSGAMVAVSHLREVGVDMETVAPAGDLALLAEQCFSPREIDLIRRSEERRRAGLFYAIWTRKEAYIKARGEGMSLRLKAIDCASVPAVLDGRWHVMDLGERGGCMCALALDGPALRVRFMGAGASAVAVEYAGAGGAVRESIPGIRGACQ